MMNSKRMIINRGGKMKGKNIRITIIMALFIGIIALGGCKKEIEENKEQGGINLNLEQLQEPKRGEEIAIIKTNHGDIKVRLFPEVAPKAVENFVTHARDGYYDGIIFHRVIKDFMIQGGDPTGTGMGGESIWGEAFEDEFDPKYHNLRGSLSMANAGSNTNGSQFFIVQSDEVDESLIGKMESIGEEGGFSEEVIKAYKELGGTPWLDFNHTVFGQVFEGMDVVDDIASVEVEPRSNKPIEEVRIETIEIVEYK